MGVLIYVLGVVASIHLIKFINNHGGYCNTTVARDFGLFISLFSWFNVLAFSLVVLSCSFSTSKFSKWLKEDL